jgi:hypothetical protein
MQTTRDILGTGADLTGAAAPRATVTVTSGGTKAARAGSTSSYGNYTFSLRRPGKCSATLSDTGVQNVRHVVD